MLEIYWGCRIFISKLQTLSTWKGFFFFTYTLALLWHCKKVIQFCSLVWQWFFYSNLILRFFYDKLFNIWLRLAWWSAINAWRDDYFFYCVFTISCLYISIVSITLNVSDLFDPLSYANYLCRNYLHSCLVGKSQH